MTKLPLHEQLTKAAHALERPPLKEGESVFEVHGTLRHLTAFYERVRTLLDYQEERFIRRLAIRRILFRTILIQNSRIHIGGSLLRELIRAAYLENATYPLQTADEIDAILEKYLESLPIIEQRYQPPDLLRMQRRLIGVAAAEIEDYLHRPDIEVTLTDRLAEEIGTYLEADRHQRRLLALRSLYKADAELLIVRLAHDSESPLHELWKKFEKEPTKHVGELVREVTKYEYLMVDRTINNQIRRLSRLLPPYLILADLAYHRAHRIGQLADQPDRLEQILADLVDERINRIQGKLRSSIIRATVYIFVTKILLGLAIEVPYDLATLGSVAYLPLSINFLIPPLLMIFAGLGIRPPSLTNNHLVVRRARLLFLEEKLPSLAELAPKESRGGILSTIFSLFYIALYILTFGGLIWLMNLLHFNFISMLVLLFFLCVVGFFAFRIRTSAHSLSMIDEREGIIFLIFDFLALPFLRVGQFLSATVRQINVILFVFDFLIEAPLKVIFVALEDWFTFLREKREELR